MSLKDVDSIIKPSYNSANEDIVEKFYNIALSESIRYDRISGFFNSTSLAIAANGVDKFINNGGKMRLICGAQLNEDDLDSINNSDELKDLIHEKFLNDYNSIEDELVKNHVKVLGWMIANDYLNIKIGINRKNDMEYSNSMLHSKIGIMYDEYGSSILFNGSVNETAFGWKCNIESLKVFKSWKNSEFMEDDIKDFEEYWEGLNPSLEIFDVPEATKKKLIEIAPKSKDDVLSLKLNSKPILREYQNEALENWCDNGYHGIFSMATGTGKTITALSCFDYLNNKKSKLLTVIVCPQKHLISQWEENLRLYDFKGKTIVASSDNPKWRADVLGYIGDLKSGILSGLVIFTTFNSFCKDKFISTLKLYGDEPSLLIVDEVHGIGSNEFRLGFNVDYTYKLGLSATPEIEDDFERTDFVYDEFGGIVYEYSLEKAIDNEFLTHYNYFPEFLDLNDDELDQYKYYSMKIANIFAKKRKSKNDETKLQTYLIKRRNIVNNAESKYEYLKEFLSKNRGIKDLIVYCTGEQRPMVQNILNEFDIPNRKFTGEESSKKVNGKSERDKILELFAKGHYHALVAIKCLDEGVDVPSTQTALLMASTLNSRQHIQRRGRILRKSPGKKIANIYDLIIFPKIKNEPESVKSILKNEQKRYNEYADLADNFSECSRKFVEKWEEIR